MKKIGLFVVSVALLCGCNSQSQESGPSATDHLLVKYTSIGTPESCRVEILSTISNQVDIYMLDYNLYLNGQKKMLSQLQFSGHDGIDYVRDKTVSLVMEEAPCDAYDIEWRDLKCITDFRDEFECPEIKTEGADIFKSHTITRN
ncbi:MAG: hypothetical protein AAFR51_18195 [Pseudomonadota bacterium]